MEIFSAFREGSVLPDQTLTALWFVYQGLRTCFIIKLLWLSEGV